MSVTQNRSAGNPAGWPADWPLVLLTTVTFKNVGAKSKVRLTMVPVDATDAEIACFAGAMAGMAKGWGSGFSIMEEMFAELQAENK